MTRRVSRRWTDHLVLASAVLATGCGLLSPESVWDRRREELNRNRSLWEGQEVELYSFSESKSCECLAGFVGPVLVKVEGGVITGVSRLSDGAALEESEWGWFDTMDQLFELVSSAIDERAHAFDVEYDEARGFPTLVSLDFVQRMADDEVTIHVGAFVAGGL